ncbi:AAA family ATPase [Candidatus Gracilibacteria bacterium]|nr:AAA family ATPase [Candidatus Gracilibacteria bacterium]
MYISRVIIKNFRTFIDFDIELNQNLQIIAGANNSGKSNFLRALNLFFNGITESSGFERSKDIAYVKSSYVSGSASAKVYIDVELTFKNGEELKIKDLDTFCYSKGKILLRRQFTDEIDHLYFSMDGTTFKDEITLGKHPINTFLKRIKFIYLPTQAEITELIRELVGEEILPTMVDGYGNKGLSKKVKELKKKMEEIDAITIDIFKEKNLLITSQFQETLSDFPEIEAGIPIENYKLEVELNNDDTIASILSKRINLVVKDASHKSLESKGSGIQKLVLITLLKYFTQNIEEKARYTNPFLIWAIDEPESYMQPKLQKKIREIFEIVSNTNQILISTHSPKLIDIHNLSDTVLFYLTSIKKPYKRKGGKYFFEKQTKYYRNSDQGFVKNLKDHFGIESNDGWLVLDKNILFEGSDDEIYFQTTYNALLGKTLEVGNLICSSSTNMPSYVEFINDHITKKSLLVKSLICLLDNDTAGRIASKKIDTKSIVKVKKTISMYLDLKDYGNINYPQMMEDMVIPEILFKSILEFILKINSSFVGGPYSFKDFYEDRKKFPRIPIMEFVDNFFDKEISASKISFQSLDVKFGLALAYKRILEAEPQTDIDFYRTSYPELVKFLENILN